MTYTITDITLGQLLGSEDTTIMRNANSILKIIRNCDHNYEDGRCMYCFKPEPRREPCPEHPDGACYLSCPFRKRQ